MSLPNAVIDALVASGCTTEQLAAAMKAANGDTEASAARKREADAVRKRRQRANVTVSHADNAGQTATDADNEDAPPSPKEIPQTPLEITPYPKTPATPKGVSPPTAKRSVRLTADWVLPPDWRAEAIQSGLPAARADLEGAKMRDWSLSSKNGAKLDWHATWRNWVKDAIDRLPKAIGSPGGKPITAAQLAKQRAMEGFQDAQSSAERDDHPALVLISQFSERGR